MCLTIIMGRLFVCWVRIAIMCITNRVIATIRNRPTPRRNADAQPALIVVMWANGCYSTLNLYTNISIIVSV